MPAGFGCDCSECDVFGLHKAHLAGIQRTWEKHYEPGDVQVLDQLSSHGDASFLAYYARLRVTPLFTPAGLESVNALSKVVANSASVPTPQLCRHQSTIEMARGRELKKHFLPKEAATCRQ